MAADEVPADVHDLVDLAGLEAAPAPPCPAEFDGLVRPIGSAVYGTRAADHSPYELEWWVDELLQSDPAPYLVVGLAGRGIQSWAMHYFLVQPSLAVFVQTAFGGVYTDDVAAASALTAQFGLVRRLIAAATHLSDMMAEFRESDIDTRLVVVESSFSVGRWAFTDRRPIVGLEPVWHITASPLADSLRALEG